MPLNKSYLNPRFILCYLAFFAILISGNMSCTKPVLTNTSAELSFSQRQVFFDTVFTTEGSTFQYFTIHNTHNQPIEISSVKLVGSYTSPFRVNLDGTPGTSFSNIRIPANDSLFCFVTVTINPTAANLPFVIEDSLQFVTNGNTQYVDLIAYGQNAYFYKPNVFPTTGPAYSVVKCGDVWDSSKPHVVFGYLVVDSGCTLTMKPGTKVYMHNNAVLLINKGGTLKIQGGPLPLGLPVVTIQGDRLESAYSTIPGQWGEIWLSPGSLNNQISWAVIKNGTVGVEADTVASWTNPTLEIDHTIIKSMSEFGLLGQGSYIVGNDDVFADCQYYCMNLSLGGQYAFEQCTIANYWSYGQRQTTALNLNNWYQDVSGNIQHRDMTRAYFGNCIIYGGGFGSPNEEEFNIDSTNPGKMNYYFMNCDIATMHSTSNPYHFTIDSTLNANPQFVNSAVDNYNIPLSSPVVGYGFDTISNASHNSFPYDVAGNLRHSSPYDLGAYAAQ